jgi:hypothetical protein
MKSTRRKRLERCAPKAGPAVLARRLLIHGRATNSNKNHSSIVTEMKVASTLTEIPTRGQRSSQVRSLTTIS